MQIVAWQQEHLDALVLHVVFVAVDLDSLHCFVVHTIQVTIRVVKEVVKLLLDAFGRFCETRKLLRSAEAKGNDLLGFNAILLGEDTCHVLYVSVVILELPVDVALHGEGDVEVDRCEVQPCIHVVEVGLLDLGDLRIVLVDQVRQLQCPVYEEDDKHYERYDSACSRFDNGLAC